METIIDNYLKILNENEIILQEGLLSSLPSKIHKLISNYKLNMVLFEHHLNKYHINTKEIKKDSKVLANSVQRMMKKNDKVEKISNFIKDATINVVSKNLKQIKSDLEVSYKTGGLKAILSSIAIIICVVYINSIFAIIAIGFFGQQIGSILTCVICAPLIEEYAKRMSVTSNFPYIYTTIFATTELMQYTSGMISMGFNPVKSFILRLLSLMMHYSTTYVQNYYHKKSIISQDNNKTEYEKDESLKGYFMGVAIHSTWNVLTVIFNSSLINLVK